MIRWIVTVSADHPQADHGPEVLDRVTHALADVALIAGVPITAEKIVTLEWDPSGSGTFTWRLDAVWANRVSVMHAEKAAGIVVTAVLRPVVTRTRADRAKSLR